MLRVSIGLALLVLAQACATPPTPEAAVLADLAPSGVLRSGINYGNPILAQRDERTGDLHGITVDLSRELARRIGSEVAFVPFDAAGKMTDALKTDAWDVAFLAVDPSRAAEISFTAPYLEVEGTYLVPAESPIRTVADADRDTVRIAAGNKSAYDLFLTRTLARAKIVRAPTPLEAIALFQTDKLEAVAGVRQALVTASANIPGSRVLGDHFMVIAQAAGVPKGHETGARFLGEFIEDVKASGFVREVMRKNGVADMATVAGPASAQ